MRCHRMLTITVNNGKDALGTKFQVPCQKCNFCLQNRRIEWAYRIQYELNAKHTHAGAFLTVTYDPEHLPIVKEKWSNIHVATLSKKHIYEFVKTLKQKQRRFERKEKLDPWKIKYYLVGEYGTKLGRPHYHLILLNARKYVTERMQESWAYGHIHVGTVTDKSINYVAKYMIDRDDTRKFTEAQKTFASMSKGIGSTYIEDRTAWHKRTLALYVMKEGKKVRMPRYYKDRIFTMEEKEEAVKLAMQFIEESEKQKMDELIRQFSSKEKAIAHLSDAIQRHYERIKLKSKSLNKI